MFNLHFKYEHWFQKYFGCNLYLKKPKFKGCLRSTMLFLHIFSLQRECFDTGKLQKEYGQKLLTRSVHNPYDIKEALPRSLKPKKYFEVYPQYQLEIQKYFVTYWSEKQTVMFKMSLLLIAPCISTIIERSEQLTDGDLQH